MSSRVQGQTVYSHTQWLGPDLSMLQIRRLVIVTGGASAEIFAAIPACSSCRAVGPEAAVCFFAFALRCTFATRSVHGEAACQRLTARRVKAKAPLNIGLSRDESKTQLRKSLVPVSSREQEPQHRAWTCNSCKFCIQV